MREPVLPWYVRAYFRENHWHPICAYPFILAMIRHLQPALLHPSEYNYQLLNLLTSYLFRHKGLKMPEPLPGSLNEYLLEALCGLKTMLKKQHVNDLLPVLAEKKLRSGFALCYELEEETDD